MRAKPSVRDPGADFVIEFFPVTISGESKCLEHEAVVWMQEDELPSLDLAPSDRRYGDGGLAVRRP